MLDRDGIINLINSYDTESKALKNEMIRLCWFMRGGLTYDESMQLGHTEREMIMVLIKENLETTKKTNLPFF